VASADLDRYSAEAAALLKDASYKRIAVAPGGFDPYTPADLSSPRQGPMTFAWGFSWTPKLEQQRPAWEMLVHGFKLAMGHTYPDCDVATMEVMVDSDRNVPMALAQVYSKFRRSIRGPMVVIETDVVCNRRCVPFEHEFDIGLTDCQDQWPMMPFNAGVMFAHDTPGAQRFLDAAMEYSCNIPQNFDPWYAYQFGLSHAYLALKGEIKIKIFPCKEYNYTPTVYAPTDAYFVHLKGDRKRMQREFIAPLIGLEVKR
jgi:hypothetical protein